MPTSALDVLKKSVQEQDPVASGGVGTSWFLEMDTAAYLDALPPWGNPGRQWALRRLYYRSHNSLVVSAIQQLIRQVKQTPHELIGGPTLSSRFQQIMQEADLGGGIDQLLSKLLLDYYTLDQGAVLELVGPGEPDTALTRPITGLVALDSLRCYFTGNLKYPVYYRSHRTGALHKMHWSRVVRLVDMPSSDPYYRGLGYSSLSRAAAVAQAEMAMVRLELQNLSDQPVNGIITFAGISDSKVISALKNFEDARQADRPPLLRNLIQLTSTEPSDKVGVTLTPFAQLPPDYDYAELIRTHVNLLALAIGVDPQDIWPLTSGSMGSGSQSKILHQKAGQGKALPDTLSVLARTWNIAILPRSMELRYKPHDTDREQSDANIAETWGTLALSLAQGGVISQAQAGLLLTNNVQAFADVLLDEAGVLRLPDNDPKDPNAPAGKPLAGDAITGVPVAKPATATLPPGQGMPQVQTHAPDAKPNTPASDRRQPKRGPLKSVDELEDIFDDRELTDVEKAELTWCGALTELLAGDQVAISIRHLVFEHGMVAFALGLSEGGIAHSDVTEYDQTALSTLLLAKCSAGASRLAILHVSKDIDAAIEAQNPMTWHAQLIEPFYDLGRRSAERDGYYRRDDAPGHVHRLSEWGRFSRLTPGFIKTSGPSQGQL